MEIVIICVLVYIIYKFRKQISEFLFGNQFVSPKSKLIDKDIEYYRKKNNKQNEINRILDKIKKVGYDNITPIEKKILKNN